MKDFLSIIFAGQLILFLFSCDSSFNSKVEYRDEKLSKINTTFHEVVTKGCDKNVHKIQDVFPGGKFFEGDLNKRIASQYRMYAHLEDINVFGRLSFSQLEDKPQEKLNGHLIRIILIKNAPMDHLEKKYMGICKFISNTYKNAFLMNTTSSAQDELSHVSTKEYILSEFDDEGDVFIGLNLDNSRNWLKITITHSTLLE